MVVAKDLIQLPCLQKWDKVRLKSPTMLVYTPPASSLTYLFWFAFLYFNWSSLLIHFTRQKNKLGKWENFCPKNENWELKVVLTLNQFDKKEKTCKKESLSSREIFLNFHSLKKKTEKFRKKSREIMRWSDEHRRASFILIFLSHSPQFYL